MKKIMQKTIELTAEASSEKSIIKLQTEKEGRAKGR